MPLAIEYCLGLGFSYNSNCNCNCSEDYHTAGPLRRCPGRCCCESRDEALACAEVSDLRAPAASFRDIGLWGRIGASAKTSQDKTALDSPTEIIHKSITEGDPAKQVKPAGWIKFPPIA